MKRKLLSVTILFALVVGLWLALHRASSPKHSAHEQADIAARPDKALQSPQAITRPVPATPELNGTVGPALSPVIQMIVSPQENFRKREAALAGLATNLTEVDRQAVHDFLVRVDPTDSDQSGQVFKNLLLNELCALNPPPAWLRDALVQIYRDRSQDVVIRDYAVQHLAEYYKQIEIASPEDSQSRRIVQNVLWEALSETDNSIAGTALLALKYLSPNRPEFSQKRIATAALQLAKNDGAGELTRITAFQVCGEMDVKDVAPVLLTAAQSGQSVALKISAVGALGRVGSDDAKSLLIGLINGTEPRLKLPARHALNQIEERERNAARSKG